MIIVCLIGLAMVLLGIYLVKNESKEVYDETFLFGVASILSGGIIFITFFIIFLTSAYSIGTIQAKIMMKEILTREERIELRKEIIEMKCHPTWYFGTGVSKLEIIEIDD